MATVHVKHTASGEIRNRIEVQSGATPPDGFTYEPDTAANRAAFANYLASKVSPEDSNRRTIEQQAAAALEDNRTYLAIGSPTNAQNLAQIRALTRQINGLIRLQLQDLGGTD